MRKLMGIFFSTMLILSFFFVFSGLAQEEKGSEDVHTIIQGDTLWGISSTFLKDPFLWPKLWAMNPYIPNPHWIYPGQLVHFSPFVELKEEKPKEVVVEEKPKEVAAEETPKEGVIGAEVKEEESPPVEKKGEAIAETQPAAKQPEISSEARSAGFLSDINFRGIGIILDSKEGKQLMSKDDIAYLAFKTKKPIMIGDKFTVFRPSELKHPVTGKKISKKYDILGNIQIIDHRGNFFTGKVTESFDAICKGDMIQPYMKSGMEAEEGK